MVLWHTVVAPAEPLGLQWGWEVLCCLPGVQPWCPEQEQPQLQPVLLHSRGCQEEHRWRMPSAVLGKSEFAHSPVTESLPIPGWICSPFLPLCSSVPAGFGCIPGALPGMALLSPPFLPESQSTTTKLMLPSCVPPHL